MEDTNTPILKRSNATMQWIFRIVLDGSRRDVPKVNNKPTMIPEAARL